jgi:hypothetical protein
MMEITPHASGVDDNARSFYCPNTPSAWMMIRAHLQFWSQV